MLRRMCALGQRTVRGQVTPLCISDLGSKFNSGHTAIEYAAQAWSPKRKAGFSQ
jgi:hypothetical protein